MLSSAPIILGIDPGARQIGVSVLKNEELVFYAVKTFRRKNRADSLRKLRLIIKRLITDYDVGIIALEKVVFVQQQRSFVKIVAEEIGSFIKRENLLLFEYNPKYIRQKICGLERPIKRNTALILSQKYFELARYFDLPRRWQRTYFALLFDAIAVGVVCAGEIKSFKLIETET